MSDEPEPTLFRVFLVENDAEYVSAISILFSKVKDCRLQTYSSAEEALESLGQSPDILIYAVQRRDSESQDLFSQLQHQNATAYFIALLPRKEAGATNEYLRAGADDCVVKDESCISRLLFSVRQGIHRLVVDRPSLQPVLSQFQNQTPDSQEARTLQPGHTILHYRILADIGQGGMGEVYKAEDMKLGRSIAIKLLPRKITKNDEAIRRLMSEARAASALNHPNIVTIHSIEEWEGLHFIVMEHIEGESLGTRIKQGPLPVPQLLDMGILVAEALAAAHEIGVIHRDIKPGNIMITENSRVKLLDFGLAKKIESLEISLPLKPASPWDSPSELTEDGQVMGTVTYMSPEQMRGEALDGRTDIFSFGCVLYEAATGKVCFPGPAIRDVMHQVLNNDPVPPGTHRPELPHEFDTVIATALAKDKDSRYATARDLADALRSVRSSVSKPSTWEMLIAVLYFENLSGSKEEEYFRDGMTEDIILELSKIKDLKVLPRSAVAAFRDKAVDPKQISRQLRASFVLDGSVRRQGDHVRITTQLLDAASGHSVWSQRYDRELKDILNIQEEIARSIAQALRITLSPQEEKAIASKPADNPNAYDYYLRGRSFVRRATHTDLEYAMQMFERAIDLEKFALAYAGLSNVCALFYDWYEPQEHWIRKAVSAVNSALVLEPELPEGLAARARIFWSQRNYEEAIRFATLALERKADCEGAYWTVGQALFSTDRWQEVADLAPAAISNSGDDYNVYVPLINAMGRLRLTHEERQLRQTQIDVLQEQLQWVPEDVRARILLATNFAFFGDKAQASQELQKAVSLRPQDANLLYNAACTYGVMGMKVEAFAHLIKAVANGFWNMEWIARDPDLACLQSDPEFQRFIEEHKRPK